MNTISPLPTFTGSFRSTGSTLAQAAQERPEGDGKQMARMATDLAVGAGMVALTGLTIVNSGAQGGLPKTGVPAIAFANIGLGLTYFIDQAIESSKAHKQRDVPKMAGTGLGMTAAGFLGAAGLAQVAGANPGFTVGLVAIAAAFFAGKEIAQLQLS